MINPALDIVLSAYRNGDLDKMLLEKPPYQYVHRYSMSPTKSDTSGLRDAIYRALPADQKRAVQSAYREAIERLVTETVGIMPVAFALMHEVGNAKDGIATLGLDVEKLARLLSMTIASNKTSLEKDRSGHGRIWPNGVYGDLQRINRIILEDGGPSILGI